MREKRRPFALALSTGSAIVVCTMVALVQVEAFGVSPVGRRWPDLLWATILGLVVVTACNYAPRQFLLGATMISLGFVTGAGIPAAMCALVALLVSARQFTWSDHFARASPPKSLRDSAAYVVVAGGLFWSTLSFDDYAVPFLSAIVAASIWFVVSLTAIVWSPQHIRRRAALLGAVAVVAMSVVAIGAGLGLRDSQQLARAAENSLRDGVRAAQTGEIDAARSATQDAIDDLTTIRSDLSSPFVSALGQFPIAAQNLGALQAPLNSAHHVLTQAADALEQGEDLGQLFDGQGLDVTQVEHLAVTAEDLIGSLHDLKDVLGEERSVWVVEPLKQRLDDVEAQAAPIDSFPEISLADGLLDLLGSPVQRSYLVLFGNTAEARELGGFAGGTALISVEDGEVALLRADRPRVPNSQATTPAAFTSPPTQRFLEHHPWLFSQNFTAMADFPSLSEALADLYPNMGGAPIDGVLYLDTQALAALVGIAGEVHLEEAGLTVTSESLGQLVHIDQYTSFDFRTGSEDRERREDREEFLAELVAATFDSLLTNDINITPEHVRDLVRAAQQDRILLVPFNEDARSLVEAIGLSGGLPEPAGQDYLAVSHLNGGPNKLDPYLERDVRYEAEIDPLTGNVEAELTITLTNTAPLGLPRYASGNNHGYSLSTNRAVVVIHTPHEVRSITGASEPELSRSWTEFGWRRHEVVAAIPSGESTTVSLELYGQIASGVDYELEIGHQPLVNTDDLTIAISGTNGEATSVDSRLSETSPSATGTFALTQDTTVAATLPTSPEPRTARTLSSPTLNEQQG